jgi:predicted transcriptional regulator
VTVSPSISVEIFIKKYLFRYHYKFFPIVENDKKLLGAISSQMVMKTPKDQWKIKKISELIIPCSSENTVHKETDALKIMEMMIRTEKSKMMVIDSEEKCVGIVALRNLLKLLSCKLDLEN